MKHRVEFTFLVLLAIAVGLSSCKENPPPQAKTEVRQEIRNQSRPSLDG